MIRPLLPLTAALALTLALTGCKKDKADPATPAAAATSTDKLTAADWHVTVHTITSGTGTIDLVATGAACNRDDKLQFKADHTLLSKYGTVRCPASQTDATGTWSLAANDSKLTYSNTGACTAAITFDVIELSSTKLQLRSTVVNGTTTIIQNITMAH